MAQLPIRESDAKGMLYLRLLQAGGVLGPGHEFVAVDEDDDLDALLTSNPWLEEARLVVKVDQIVKRRGANGLVALDLDWAGARRWIEARCGEVVTIGGLAGRLERFVVERFVPHEPDEERYVCLRTARAGDELLLLDRGGVEVCDVDSAAARITLDIDDPARSASAGAARLGLSSLADERVAARFLAALSGAAAELHFSYAEINPLLVRPDGVRILDLAVKVDDSAPANAGKPVAPFGFRPSEAEMRVRELDARTGASLKLTVLDPGGRVWLLVAGGGASVAYADTVFDLGAGGELANYGEYSGDPTETLTYEYARVILELMTEGTPDGRGKVLLLGGAIANFTDVAATFAGIARALGDFAPALRAHDVRVFVRRGGPNAEAGLSLMSEVCQKLGVPSVVQGADSTLTSIVALALEQLRLNVEETGARA